MASESPLVPPAQSAQPAPANGRFHTVLRPGLLTTAGAVVLALLTGAALIALLGVNPLEAYRALLDGALGNRNSIAETLVKAIPLALAGVGVAVAFRAGVFNVGAEGQLYLGAIAATWVGLQFQALPRPFLLPLMIFTALASGGVWAALAGVLKASFNASELINTIMMNYIAIFLVSYLVHGPLQEPGSPLGQTAPLPPQAQLATLLPATRLHSGLILALVAAVIVHVLLWRTTWGFRIRVTGKNPLAAQSAGISFKTATVSAFIVSGALAGLAGFSEAAGLHQRMIENISPGYGYTAIVVALLGQLNPPGVLAAALLFAALQVGAGTMESAVGVPSSVVTIIQYLIVIFIIGRGTFALIGRKWRRARPTK